MATSQKPQAKPSADLPEGYELVQPAQQAPQEASKPDGSALPEGYVLQQSDSPHALPEAESHTPYVVDQAKKAVASTFALPALATDVVQAGLDTATGAAKAVMNPLTSAVKKLVGLPESAEAKKAKEDWFIGNDPKKENVGGYKQATRGLEMLLRGDQIIKGNDGAKDVVLPKDSFGNPSKSAELQGRIAGFIAASAIPGMGTVAASERKFLTAFTELAGSTMSGTGAQFMKEFGESMGPKFGLTAERGGQLGEAFGGMFGPGFIKFGAQAVAKTTQQAVSIAEKGNITGFSKEAQSKSADVIVNKEMLKAVNANPTSKENIAEAIALQNKIDNFKPTAGQASGGKVAIETERQIAKSSPEALAKASMIDSQNQAAIAKYTESKFPSTKMPVNESAQAKRNADLGRNLADEKNVERQLNVLSDQYARSVDKQGIGEQFRALYNEKRTVAKERLNTQIQDVYDTAKKVGVKTDLTDVRDTVQKLVGTDRNTFQNAPPIFQEIMAKLAPPKAASAAAPVQSRGSNQMIRKAAPAGPQAPNPSVTEASFETLHSLWQRANRDSNDYRMAGKLAEAHQVDQVRDLLKQKVDGFAGTSMGPVGEKFAQFNMDYTKYSQTFKEGAGGMMAARTKKGFGTDAEDIVNKAFLRTGDKKKGLNDFFQIYGRDNKAAELLHDGLTDSFSKAVIDSNGDFSAGKAKLWMKQNETAMKELPEMSKKLGGITDLADSLVIRKKELVGQRKVLDKSVMTSVAREVKPEALVESGLSDPRVYKALLASAKTVESKQSIARAIVDMTVVKVGEKGGEFLTKNEATLKPVMDTLGKDHWQNLKDIAKAEEITNRVKPPTSVDIGKIQDPFEQYLGTSGKGLLQRNLNANSGRVGKPYIVADVAGRFIFKFRTEQVAQLREAAYFDPDLSALLKQVVTTDHPPLQALLDLKRISFDFGISIGSHALRTVNDADKPENKNKLPKDPNEGEGKWRKKRSDWLY